MPDEPREASPTGERAHDGDAAWEPDGTDLAKALLARARAAGRSGAKPRRGTSSGRTSSSRWRAPGAGWSGPSRDERDPQSLSDAVDKLVGEHGWEEDLSVHGVMARWEEMVGSELAAHVTPDNYADGVLTVRAESTAWATQVRLLAAQLVRRLNEEIGQGRVVRVDVRGPRAPSWRKGSRRVQGRGPRDTYG